MSLRSFFESAGIASARVHIPGDLVEFLNLIAGAELILTVDTAAAHFATALDRACVVLFSGLHSGMFGPWRRSARQRWLLPEAPPGKTKFKWHAGIAPTRVAAQVREVMQFLACQGALLLCATPLAYIRLQPRYLCLITLIRTVSSGSATDIPCPSVRATFRAG